jgi:mono/diheme cytochrome c family protein
MGVLLFVLFWVLLGVGILIIAIRGGPRAARGALYGQTRRSRRVAGAVLTVVYLGLGIAVPAVVIAGGRDHPADVRGAKNLDSQQTRGRALFGEFCVQCHTLRAANAVGKVGPNLDELRPPKALVLDAVLHGRARGNGRMPAGLVQGRDAQAVAAFVSKVAGQE